MSNSDQTTQTSTSDVWDIEILERRLYKRVIFTDPVDEEDAWDKFCNGDYEDVLDEEPLEIIEMCKATPVKVNI